MSGPRSEQAKAAAEPPLGLYVHVPFCASTCDFCGFYQVEPTAETIRGFLDGVGREAGLAGIPRPAETVFWGGGTPGLLSPGALARLAETVVSAAGGRPREWTVELAPGSVTVERLSVLREAGVTRVSLGVQSLVPARLEALGRRHTREQALRAYDRIRSAGFPSVNVDLMFALPGQSDEEWMSDLDAAIGLAPDHLSTYCLTFEEDTALWVKLAKGQVRLDPEREARLYEATWERLGSAGFEQYEVSNFARPGHACRHNLNTWLMHEWIGLGPAAASQAAGWRGSNVADLARWLSDLDRGVRMTEDRTRLSADLLLEDGLIFGLRLNEGVDLGLWRSRCPNGPWDEVHSRLDRLAAEGWVVRTPGRARLTVRGRLLADAVGGEFIGLAASAAPAAR
jgi:oxygen-independent coproporphyrinogen-3 oxidase